MYKILISYDKTLVEPPTREVVVQLYQKNYWTQSFYQIICQYQEEKI